MNPRLFSDKTEWAKHWGPIHVAGWTLSVEQLERFLRDNDEATLDEFENMVALLITYGKNNSIKALNAA